MDEKIDKETYAEALRWAEIETIRTDTLKEHPAYLSLNHVPGLQAFRGGCLRGYLAGLKKRTTLIDQARREGFEAGFHAAKVSTISEAYRETRQEYEGEWIASLKPDAKEEEGK